MSKVNFFTAVSFVDQPNSWLETVDNYFYLGGEKAHVVPGHTKEGIEGAVLVEDSTRCIITALKVLSYFTIVIPLVMLLIKAALRWNHSFHIIDVKQKIEEGINIPESSIERIQRLLPKIQARQIDEEIEYFSPSGTNDVVFSLKSAPGLIFKIPQYADEEFANMVNDEQIRLLCQLNLLTIPHAKKFSVGSVTIIAKERIQVQSADQQEGLYARLTGLNETVKQLTTFIAKTKRTSIGLRHIPIVDDAPDFQGSRRVVLLSGFGRQMRSAEWGIFGFGNTYPGLISCLFSEEHMNIVQEEARRCGVTSDDAEQIKDERLQKARECQELQEYYRSREILENPGKPIEIYDIRNLGLDLDRQTKIEDPNTRQTQIITLEDTVDVVTILINDAIKEKSERLPIKDRREVLVTHKSSSFNPTQRNWLPQILHALKVSGYLYSVEEETWGYRIQA